MLFYGIDSTYLLLVLPAVLFALWAQSNVQSTFKKYSKVSAGMTGYDSARAILDANGLKHVRIERVAGNLTDHFDPKANVIRLSQSVHDATTAAAVGVAAHEAGHAVQYAVGYTPMKFRGAIIPITNIGSNLAMPLILLGILLSFPTLAYLGIAAFGLSTLFQLVTLPVEFNASGRAMDALKSGGRLSGDEVTAAGRVLRAAALTYVAALAVSLANLLRFVSLVNRSRK
jgi:Zn-dependent membrane protease YugP